MSTGKKLRELIKAKKVKQVDLAEYLSISPSRLSNYLHERREPDFNTLAKAAKYLSVDLNYFANIKIEGVFKSGVYELPKEKIYGDDGCVCAGIFNINAKKDASPEKILKLDKRFFNVDDNAVVYYVNVINSYFRPGSYLVCSKIRNEPQNGDYLIFPGRNAGIYEYIENKKLKLLIYKNKIDFIDANKIRNCYKVEFVINSAAGLL